MKQTDLKDHPAGLFLRYKIDMKGDFTYVLKRAKNGIDTVR